MSENHLKVVFREIKKTIILLRKLENLLQRPAFIIRRNLDYGDIAIIRAIKNRQKKYLSFLQDQHQTFCEILLRIKKENSICFQSQARVRICYHCNCSQKTLNYLLCFFPNIVTFCSCPKGSDKARGYF